MLLVKTLIAPFLQSVHAFAMVNALALLRKDRLLKYIIGGGTWVLLVGLVDSMACNGLWDDDNYWQNFQFGRQRMTHYLAIAIVTVSLFAFLAVLAALMLSIFLPTSKIAGLYSQTHFHQRLQSPSTCSGSVTTVMEIASNERSRVPRYNKENFLSRNSAEIGGKSHRVFESSDGNTDDFTADTSLFTLQRSSAPSHPQDDIWTQQDGGRSSGKIASAQCLFRNLPGSLPRSSQLRLTQGQWSCDALGGRKDVEPVMMRKPNRYYSAAES
jgi:hypothetical protein